MKKQTKELIAVIIFLLFVMLAFIAFIAIVDIRVDSKHERLTHLLDPYPKGENMVAVDLNTEVYYHDRTIHLNHANGEEALLCTKDYLYYSSMNRDKKIFSIYRYDIDSQETECIFDKPFKKYNEVAIMYDEKYIFLISEDKYYSFDIQTQAYTFIGETNDVLVEYYRNLKTNSSYTSVAESSGKYTITRTLDGVHKSIDIEDVKNKSKIAEQLNAMSELEMYGVSVSKDKIFVNCYAQPGIIIIYEYDFESEDISLYSWQKVGAPHDLRLFFLN